MTSVQPQLMEHQKEGVAFLSGQSGGLLAFEQGLGKTFIALRAFEDVRSAGTAERLLVICPNSLKRNWLAEIQKWTPELDAIIIEGTSRERRTLFLATDASAVIVSYETARAEITAILALLQRHATALVLDESHAAKNWQSLTSAAARQFAPHAKFRWLLSGTPVTNSPEDLFTQVEILAPGEHRLGNKDSFMLLANENPAAAKAKTSGLVFRRTKDECLDLPDKTFVDVSVELPVWQRKLYDAMRDEMVCELRAMSGEEYRAQAVTALSKITRLMQIASNPALVLPVDGMPGKFEALDNIVADILSVPGRKVIIWCNYVGTIEELTKRYAAHGSAAIYGGTPVDERQQIAADFQNGSSIRVLIGNPAAAGTGFTFTAAAFTIYESLSWRYDFYAQSQDRNHRIGQSLPVTYFRLIAADTIEKAIVEALERKGSMASGLLGDKKQPSIASFSRDEMIALLQDNKLPV
jgi:SNF2 family DNA or RNA helicase